MRLILKLNMAEEIEREITAARESGSTVERVEVTEGEMDRLMVCPSGPRRTDPLGQRFRLVAGKPEVVGVPVTLEVRP